MKKVIVATLALLVGGVVFLGYQGGAGFTLLGLERLWNEQKAELGGMAMSFLEDIQYKDFDAAAAYHTFADRGDVDIPMLIERLFQVKPEQLNIRDIRVTRVTFDRDGKRARTFFLATTELLNSAEQTDEEQNRERQVEGILYWHRRPASDGEPPVEVAEGEPPVEVAPAAAPGDPEKWFMMLESSLR